MNPDFYRRLAQQCRHLLTQARTEPARRQLEIWVNEFERQAEAARHEQQQQSMEPHGG